MVTFTVERWNETCRQLAHAESTLRLAYAAACATDVRSDYLERIERLLEQAEQLNREMKPISEQEAQQ